MNIVIFIQDIKAKSIKDCNFFWSDYFSLFRQMGEVLLSYIVTQPLMMGNPMKEMLHRSNDSRINEHKSGIFNWFFKF